MSDVNSQTAETSASAEVQTETASMQDNWVESAVNSGSQRHVQINVPVLGTLLGYDEEGAPYISHDYSDLPHIKALSTVKLKEADIDQPVTLIFNQGDASKPIIIGVIQEPAFETDEEPLVLESEHGIELKCGQGKIVLDPTGGVFVQGSTINTQAYGTNQLKGGVVKIN